MFHSLIGLVQKHYSGNTTPFAKKGFPWKSNYSGFFVASRDDTTTMIQNTINKTFATDRTSTFTTFHTPGDRAKKQW
jgi:hypothetical protein